MQRLEMRSVYRIALFWGVLGSLLPLTGCFNRLDTRAIEQEIEAEIESQSRRLSLAEVRCPRDVYRQSGSYFRCVGYLRPEGQFTINVTQQDSQGSIEWDVPNSQVILNMVRIEDKLQEDFAKQFSRRAVLDCGEMYRVNQPGEEFVCEVIGDVNLGQEKITALLVKVDPEGNLNWYEVREAIAPVANATPPQEGQTAPPQRSAPGNQTGAAPETQNQGASEPRERVAGTRKIKPPVVAP